MHSNESLWRACRFAGKFTEADYFVSGQKFRPSAKKFGFCFCEFKQLFRPNRKPRSIRITSQSGGRPGRSLLRKTLSPLKWVRICYPNNDDSSFINIDLFMDFQIPTECPRMWPTRRWSWPTTCRGRPVSTKNWPYYRSQVRTCAGFHLNHFSHYQNNPLWFQCSAAWLWQHSGLSPWTVTASWSDSSTWQSAYSGWPTWELACRALAAKSHW